MKGSEKTKWLAFSALAVYLFYYARRNNQSIQGNPLGLKGNFNSELAIDVLTAPIMASNPYIGAFVKNGAKRLFSGLGSRYGVNWNYRNRRA